MSRDQNEGRSHSIKTDNSTFEWVEKLKYFGTTLTNRNYVQEEIKSRLKWGNACYHSVQNLLSSSLLSRHSKTKIYRTIILPVVLYGCKTWSLPPREECRQRVFENRVLRRIFGNKRDEITGGALDCIVTSLMICTAHVLRWSIGEEWDRGGM